MNYKYICLNPIAAVGLNNLDDRYARTEDFAAADAVFVRSAKMDEMVPGANLLAVARAGAGVNNIPHAEYAKKGIVVFNTPGANANGVKELVIALRATSTTRRATARISTRSTTPSTRSWTSWSRSPRRSTSASTRRTIS